MTTLLRQHDHVHTVNATIDSQPRGLIYKPEFVLLAEIPIVEKTW